MPECHGGAVLRDREVHARIAVEVGGGRTSLVAQHSNAALLHALRTESTHTVAQKQQPGPGVEAHRIDLGGKEVLR